MKEKLLALLIAKFAGVSKATLERIAEKKAGSVTDEAQLQSIADGIDYGQIVQSEVDSKVTESNKLAVSNYERKHNLKDGKPASNEPPQDPPKPDDIATMVTKAVTAAVAPLQQELQVFKQKELQNNYLGKVKTTLSEKKIPESFWGKRSLNIESDEQLTTVVAEIETDWTAFRQEQINAGVMIDKPASGSGPVGDGESLAKQIEAGTKEIVEQTKK